VDESRQLNVSLFFQFYAIVDKLKTNRMCNLPLQTTQNRTIIKQNDPKWCISVALACAAGLINFPTKSSANCVNLKLSAILHVFKS